MVGKTIIDAGQQGKYFWMIMSSPPHPVMHFGMTGWLKFNAERKSTTLDAQGGRFFRKLSVIARFSRGILDAFNSQIRDQGDLLVLRLLPVPRESQLVVLNPAFLTITRFILLQAEEGRRKRGVATKVYEIPA
jgi:hypothetical protein